MLSRRLFASAIILAVLFFLIWLDIFLAEKTGHVGWIFVPMILLISLAAGHELRSMWLDRKDCPNLGVVLVGIFLIISFSCAPILWQEYPANCHIGKIGWTLFGFAAALGAAFIYEMVKFQGDESGVVTGRLSRTVLIFGYIGVLVSFVSALRYFGDNRLGMFAFFSVSATVKVADSAAYFVGKSFGRHKLAPLLSPGKTVEGTLAGLVGGVLGAFITFFLVAPIFVDREQPFAWWAVIIFGLGVTVAGMIGDLAESLLKRVAKTKDSSSWLPGLGGVMDIIDSVLVAAPVAFAIWASGILD